MKKVVISLGSNKGNSKKILQKAILELERYVIIVKKSPVKRTEPISNIKQNAFYNQILICITRLKPFKLLKVIHKIEKASGRNRLLEKKNGPRTLDIDIIDYGFEAMYTKNLTLPHPRAHKRAFVIELWKIIEPNAVLPYHGRIDKLKTFGKVY